MQSVLLASRERTPCEFESWNFRVKRELMSFPRFIPTLDYHYPLAERNLRGRHGNEDEGEDLIQATLARKVYTEVSKLGEGGMGVDYKCRHADGGLRVLKFSRGDFDASEDRHSWRRATRSGS